MNPRAIATTALAAVASTLTLDLLLDWLGLAPPSGSYGVLLAVVGASIGGLAGTRCATATRHEPTEQSHEIGCDPAPAIGATQGSVQGEHSTDPLQEALAELRDLKVAVDEASIVSVADAKGRISYINDQFERISGYPKSEVIGQDHRILNSRHHSRDFWSEMYRTIHRGGVWKNVIRNRAKDGSFYWVASTMKGIFGADGTLRKIVSIRTDVTALKTHEEELRRAMDAARAADRAKGELLADMSHEIRTPMTAILGFIDILLDEGDFTKAPPERLRLISDIHRNGDHLLSLINDILDLSKIEAGRLEARCVASSPAQVVLGAIESLRHRAEEKGLQLRYELSGSLPPTVNTDPGRLRQIVLNLVGNAIKFTERGSVKVRLSTTPDAGGQLVCEVIDTGIGISEIDHQQRFRPFSQVDSSSARRYGGTGLGLTISRRLAKLLGGSLEFHSRADEGSTFELRIPLQQSSLAELHARHEPIEESTTRLQDLRTRSSKQVLAGRNILLAEDGPDNRRIIQHFLNRAGASVECVDNGRSAVERARAARSAGQPFDVVLMDIQMPVLDGLEAVRELRNAGYVGAIIALTAHAMAGDRDACLAAGCDDYLTKPVERTRLLDRCATLAEKGRGQAAA